MKGLGQYIGQVFRAMVPRIQSPSPHHLIGKESKIQVNRYKTTLPNCPKAASSLLPLLPIPIER